MDITVVKADREVITAQADMNLIVVCERIMEIRRAWQEDESDDDDDERIIKILDLDGSWC